MKVLLRIFTMCVVLLTLAACGVTVKTSGQKFNEPTRKIQSLLIFARDEGDMVGNDPKALNLIPITTLATMVEDVFKSLENRLPQAFQNKGLQPVVYRSAKGFKLTQASAKQLGAAHVLFLTPVRASGYGRTEARLEMAVSLVEAEKSRVLWRGTVSYSNSTAFASARGMDQVAADQFAAALIEQMTKDGLLN